MILHRLYELADRLQSDTSEQSALPSPGYQPVLITQAIRLTREGRFRDVVPLSGVRRGKREGMMLNVPRGVRTSGVRPWLLSDNPAYVLGRQGNKSNCQRVNECHAAYVELLRECATATQEATVSAVLRWLEAGGAEQLRNSDQIADDDELIIEVDGTYPTDLPAVQEFWHRHSEHPNEAVCLITGKFGPVVERMPFSVKGVPGGQPSGTTLIGVNFDAAESYGLKAALNSPISPEAAEKVHNALNWLLRDRRHHLRAANTIFLYWTREPTSFDLTALLEAPDPADVERLLKAPATGAKPAQFQERDFYMLGLGANSGRACLRTYHEESLANVQQNVARWFRALAIVGHDGSPARPRGIGALAKSLFQSDDKVSPGVPADLFRCAITGAPLPRYLLTLAIQRNRAEQGPYETKKGARFLSEARISLTKALVCHKEEPSMKALYREHPDPAYHCGRLLAVLERIQRTALGKINTTVADRYYGAASASPASVLGTLVADAQAHLSKLRKENREYFLERELEEILTAIGPEFPRTLNLTRQGLFALGFYHQRANDRPKQAEGATDLGNGNDDQEKKGEEQ